MKKLLLTTILATALSCMQADATMITIDYIGETYVTSHNIERSLIANSDDGTYYNIALKPLEESITNGDGSVSIPLEYLFINNSREDVYLKFQEYSNIFWGTEMNGVPRVMNAKIKNYGIVPAGTYSILFEVQAIDIETQEIAVTSSFNLQFIVPAVHELNTYNESPQIKFGAKDVFNKSAKVATETAPMIYIRSNTDWILSLDTTDFEDTNEKYYVRTLSSSGKVTSRLQEKALITPGKEIILAIGKAPAENDTVSIEYSVENPEEGVIRAGEYTKRLKYILREGE